MCRIPAVFLRLLPTLTRSLSGSPARKPPVTPLPISTRCAVPATVSFADFPDLPIAPWGFRRCRTSAAGGAPRLWTSSPALRSAVAAAAPARSPRSDASTGCLLPILDCAFKRCLQPPVHVFRGGSRSPVLDVRRHVRPLRRRYRLRGVRRRRESCCFSRGSVRRCAFRPAGPPGSVDLVVTSPPYANRMSYVRELRPYLYWLRFLRTPDGAGDLDWSAVGGPGGGRYQPARPLAQAARFVPRCGTRPRLGFHRRLRRPERGVDGQLCRQVL